MEAALQLFLTFIVYAFLGWCCECVYCSVPAGKFINRGFLNGPICPVYGFGAVIVFHALRPLGSNVFLTFFGGMLLTSALEYVTSVLLEKLFHLSWWDYSKRKFNLHGRICLLNSTLFGLLCVFAVHVVDPWVSKNIQALSAPVLFFCSGAIAALLSVDCFVSVRSVLVLNGRLQQIAQLRDDLRHKAEASAAQLKTALESGSELLREERLRARIETEYAEHRLHQLEEEHAFTTRRLMSAFPRLDSVRQRGTLAEIRKAVADAAARRRAEKQQKRNEKR